MDADPATLLSDARRRAAKLLDDLLAQRAELEHNPSRLEPADLEAGRAALAAAIAAAERTVRSLDEALSKQTSHE